MPSLRGARNLFRTVLAAVVATAVLGPAAPAHVAPAGYTVHGIDVSAYQGTIVWSSVASSGVQFAYARASLGNGYTDPTYGANHDGAKSNGLFFGAYHFARPDLSGGRAQADFFLDRARFANDGRTLPPMLDIEWASGVPTCFGLSQSQMASWVGDFVDRVRERTGRLAMIYTNRNWWNPCVGTAASFGHHPLAQPCYCSSPGTLPNGWSRFTIWQYTSTGSVPGVSGNVDQDVFNGSYAQLTAFAGTHAHDFTGDGNPDVMARTAAGPVYLYRGNGAGGFQSGSDVVAQNWSGFNAVWGVGDFTGDGNPDVMGRTAAGPVYLYRGNGTGGFQSGSDVVAQNWSGFNAIF